jgi:hypothetical protein
MSHECQRCGENKAASEMVVRGGKPSRTCVACFREAMSSRNRNGKSGGATDHKKRTAKAVELQAPAIEPTTGRLVIEPGHGIDTWIENDMVQVAQGESVHAYTRSEWKVMAAHHADWAAA